MGTRHPSPPQLDAWRAFLGAHSSVIRVLDRELRAEHDLPLTWYDVLVQLSEAGGRLRMSDLADAVLLTRYNCTRLVDRMATDGLIEREADPGDARVRWAVLTAEGTRRLHESAPTHMRGIQDLFGAIVPDDEAPHLSEMFTAMHQAAQQQPS